MIISVILITLNSLLVDSAIKTWHPKPIKQSYTGNLECAKQNIIFPSGVTIVPKDLGSKLAEVVLPTTGVLILQDNANLIFQNKMTEKCQRLEHFTEWEQFPVPWYISENWETTGELNNQAIPHIDRIPCECDTVVFPTNQSVSIDFELTNEIVVDKIQINGRFDDFQQFLQTEIGQMMFSNEYSVNYVPGVCNPPKYCGCHNYKRFHEYINVLCFEETIMCPIPHCLNPITPIGHCCPICGVVWQIPIKNSCDFDLTKFKKLWRKRINLLISSKYMDLIDYYAGIMPGSSDQENYVQLIVMDKGEYVGNCIKFMNNLNMDKQLGFNIRKYASGTPYLPNESSPIWALIFVTLLFVLIIYAMIYVNYVDSFNIPKWIPTTRFRLFPSPFLFARFDNKTGDGDTDSIAVEFNPQTASSFDNPLFKDEINKRNIETIGPNALNDEDNANESKKFTSNLVEIELDSSEMK